MVVDFVGQKINLGDIIVYTNKTGSNTRTNVGVVREIVSVPNKWDLTKNTIKLKIRPTSEEWVREVTVDGGQRGYYRKIAAAKDSIIERIDRICKVRFEDISPELQEIFRPFLPPIAEHLD